MGELTELPQALLGLGLARGRHVHGEGPGLPLCLEGTHGAARELVLERVDEGVEVECVVVESDTRRFRPGRIVADGQKVRVLEEVGATVRPDQHRRDQVELQTREVREVVSRERLPPQVGVDQSDPAKPAPAGARAPQVRQKELLGLAHDDVHDPTGAVEREPDLPAGLRRELRDALGERHRDDALLRDLAVVELLETVTLARLEPGEVSMDLHAGRT